MAIVRGAVRAVVVCGMAVGLVSCVSGGVLGFEDLEVGQCYNEVDATLESGTNELILQFDVVDCAEPHHGEAVAVLTIALAAYDEWAIVSDLEARCDDAFLAYVGIEPEQSRYENYFDWPTEKQWDAGIRSGVCLATEIGEMTEGSIAEAAQ